MYLVISNKGLIEAGALSLMGASVKDEEAIGKFGSGFKYALATLVRFGLEVKIFSGKREIPIETRPETFRDREFQVLWIDGIRTSITTATGREWEIRDAVREVWSNARDEGHPLHYVTDNIRPIEGHTLVAIECRADVSKMVDNWHQYFIEDLPHLHANRSGRIVEQQVANIFRRGVWVCEDRTLTSYFSFDLTDIQLPESRKISPHAAIYEVFATLAHCTEEKVWEKLWANRKHTLMEWHVISTYNMSRGYPGREAAQKAFYKNWDYYGNQKMQDRVKTSGERVLWVEDNFAICCSALGIPNILDKTEHSADFEIKPWPIGYEDRIIRHVLRLEKVGINIGKFPIKYCEFVADYVGLPPIACAFKGTCYVTDKAFEADPRMLDKALIEEWTHLEKGVQDHTVEQQHVYLNLILDLIEKVEKK